MSTKFPMGWLGTMVDARRSRRVSLWLQAVLAIGMAGIPTFVSAQTFEPFLESEIPFDVSRGRNISVRERPREEYAQIGIRSGAFILLPSTDIGATYTNNVFGAETNKKSDAFGELHPQIIAHSDWSRNAVQAVIDADLKRYLDATIRNQTGFSASVDGRLDFGLYSSLYASGSYRRAFEEQYSGSFPTNAVGVVQYSLTKGVLRGTYQGARVRLIGSFDANELKYSAVSLADGTKFDQSFRNRTVYRASARAEYAFLPDVAVFVQSTYSKSDYLSKLAVNDRDNEEVRVLGGLTFDLSALARANIGGGYVHRSYDLATFRSISGPFADIRLELFPNEITTVTIVGQRSIEDAAFSTASGYYATRASIRIDHELLRNLILFADGGAQRDSYRGIDRTDKLYKIEGGTIYMLNRGMTINATTDYISRKSNGSPIGQIFNEWRSTVALTLKV